MLIFRLASWRLFYWLASFLVAGLTTQAALATELPALKVEVAIDYGADLFKRLPATKQEGIADDLRAKLLDWLEYHAQRWSLTTTSDPEHRLTLEVADLGDASGGKATVYFKVIIWSFDDQRLGKPVVGTIPRQITNRAATVKSFLSKDLEFAFDGLEAVVEQKLGDMFSEIEGDLGTKAEISYVLTPEPGTPEFWPNRVRRVWDNGRGDVRRKSRSSQHFADVAYFDRPGMTLAGTLSPVPKSSKSGAREANKQVTAAFCVERVGDETLPSAGAEFSCRLGEDCTLDQSEPSDWFAACSDDASFFNLPSLFPISSARAAETDQIWTAPSLDTMTERSRSGDIPNLGFTIFDLTAKDLRTGDADGYRLALKSNDVPIWIDGIAPEKLVYPYNPNAGFFHQFPLETLNFFGGNRGCDTITAEITFLAGDRAIGEPVVLRRPYAALRDALPFRQRNDIGEFDWAGRYVHPRAGDEYQLFVDSAAFKFGDDADRKKLMDWLHSVRRALHDLGWEIPQSILGIGDSDEPATLVGVMRPPLQEVITKPGYYGYGVAVGVRLPSGHVQIVFPKAVIRSLAQYLAKRAETAPRAGLTRRQKWLLDKRIVPLKTPDAYIRRNRRADAVDLLPWVCNTAGELGRAG